jgi:hypothetical protein
LRPTSDITSPRSSTCTRLRPVDAPMADMPEAT